ncbi:hypothetical protein [Fortiea contorta]|uniref:hypothetical protein n=1 Tax=Fortiea contorta TaxID=1892405 RepID=UPI000348B0B1|nr:hypothetical protein [Fortiea contorta]
MIRTYIWLPRLKYGGSVASSITGWGHAAIEIIDGVYISKWPKREDTPFGYTMCYEEDLDICGTEDEVIEISNLDEKAMTEYWEKARKKEFNDVFHNCCRVSAKTLNHGFYWSNFNSISTYFKRFGRTYSNLSGSTIHAYGEFFNQITTWTPYTVSGLAKYIKKIVE